MRTPLVYSNSQTLTGKWTKTHSPLIGTARRTPRQLQRESVICSKGVSVKRAAEPTDVAAGRDEYLQEVADEEDESID